VRLLWIALLAVLLVGCPPAHSSPPRAQGAEILEVPGGWIYTFNSGYTGRVYVPDPEQWVAPPPVPAVEPAPARKGPFVPGPEKF
jgi:hypothetical protein